MIYNKLQRFMDFVCWNYRYVIWHLQSITFQFIDTNCFFSLLCILVLDFQISLIFLIVDCNFVSLTPNTWLEQITFGKMWVFCLFYSLLPTIYGSAFFILKRHLPYLVYMYIHSVLQGFFPNIHKTDTKITQS